MNPFLRFPRYRTSSTADDQRARVETAEHLLALLRLSRLGLRQFRQIASPFLRWAKSWAMMRSLQPAQKDFDQMMQMLTGYFVTQVAGALATYSIADHLAKGPATADEIATWAGVDPQAAF